MMLSNKYKKIFSLLLFLGLVCTFHLAFSENKRSLEAVEKTRESNIEDSKPIEWELSLLEEISPEDKEKILLLKTDADQSNDDMAKAEYYKNLSSKWYNLNYKVIAGYYAELKAKIEQKNAIAWNLACTTYLLAADQTKESERRSYAISHASTCIENAISIDPENVDYKINKALIYTEYPEMGQPMIGIQLLIQLNKSDTNNIKVINQLARLAIKSNQYEKAHKRLEKALALQPRNKMSNCLMVEYLIATNQVDGIKVYKNICDN